jgi:hypothetical protein
MTIPASCGTSSLRQAHRAELLVQEFPMFDRSDLNALEPPDHQLPEDVVAGLASVIISELPHMPHGLAEELKAAIEMRTADK